ncbi:MAG: hypothetical protein MUC95_06655 [Spirochaetes bacterium]|jgi:hypothetical protein|nr:hypothetical protein [Spirochaetota bacterium]
MKKLKSFIRQSPHDPVITGLYKCDMALAYFPSNKVEMFLPRAMSIPSDSIMAEKYPTVKKIKGMHPFLLQGSTGYKVHPLIYNRDFRAYEEIMFYFPVIYRHGNEEQLCSYVPVLYLEYLFGVIVGNLYFKFRKEYHPEMIIEETDAERCFNVKKIINSSFPKTGLNNKKELDPFFVQTFKNPTVTVSYLNQPYFYHTDVFDITKVYDTSPVYEWNYKGSVIRNNEHTFGNYSEFTFTLSKVMRYNDFFHPKD